MVATGIIGCAAYVLLFGERLRSRGQTRTVVTTFVLSLLLGAVVAAVYWAARTYWR